MLTGDALTRIAQLATRKAPLSSGGALDLLLVDDDASVLAAIGDALQGLGHAVTRVSTEPQALALLEERSFDVILTDAELQ